MSHNSTSGIWLHHIENGQAIERVSTPHIVLSLLASKNGTEIIHHALDENSVWALTPQLGWDELESVFLLTGKMSYQSGLTTGMMHPGDLISAEPVNDHVLFTALEHSTFLYISSDYVFHNYSKATEKFTKLAVDIEVKDGYTASHCDRIRSMSYRTGERLGLSSTQLFTLQHGAFFHDIGKINIPSEILTKPSKLSREEFDIIKTHAVLGEAILSSTNIPHLVGAAVVAEQHHERFDGSGYPYGLEGEEIDIRAAIVAVVDSFDAMTSNRPYQLAKSREQSISEISLLRGKLYHPDVVDAFLAVLYESSL